MAKKRFFDLGSRIFSIRVFTVIKLNFKNLFRIRNEFEFKQCKYTENVQFDLDIY